MLSSLEATEHDRVTSMMRALLVRNALHHRRDGLFDRVDLFSALKLEQLGLVQRTGVVRPPDNLVAVITTPGHEMRLSHPPGPLLFLKDEPFHSSVVSPAELLADVEPELRLAAAQFFSQLPERALAKRSRRMLNDTLQEIASSDASRWIPACNRIDEVLRNDVYLVLAGFKQCYELEYEAGIERYLPRLLRPDVALLRSIEFDAWDPVAERLVVEKLVARAADADTFDGAMDEYYRNLGHFPLTGALGAASVVKLWSKERKGFDIWAALWAWADKHTSPLPRFHASSACLADPTIVPDGLEAVMWGEIAEVARGNSSAKQESRWWEAWQIREKLAQHLGNHLSCLTPGFASERIYGTAWWLTERVCEAFPVSPSLLQEIRETTIAAEGDRSAYVNTLMHPPIGRSGIRYLTQIVNRVWSTAIIGELSTSPWLPDRFRPLPDDRRRIEDAVLETIVQAYPPPTGNEPRIFGFDHSIERLITAWTGPNSEMPEERRNGFNELLRIDHLLNARDGLLKLIEGLAGNDTGTHRRLAHALRMRAYTFDGADTEFREHFYTSALWKQILMSTDSAVLSHVFEALAESAAQDGEQWRPILPHLFASAAERTTDDEHRRILLTMTIWSCLNTSTVGALNRLMHGSHRSEFIPVAEQWHSHLQSMNASTTPWTSGKIRSVLTHLIADEMPGSGDD